MQSKRDSILLWLPSPMGDAILSVPALRAIREHFAERRIIYFCKPFVRDILTPCRFNDDWITEAKGNPFSIGRMLRDKGYSDAILFKNSFGSGLSVFLAGIPHRIGYSRDGRGIFLTEKLYPVKDAQGRYKSISMVDYYLGIASRLGAKVSDRRIELGVLETDKASVQEKLPGISESASPVVILVPGGAFGPSKCWPSARFAEVADLLISKYDAQVLISVSPELAELSIARQICAQSSNELINLGEKNLTIGELKAVYSGCELVISNDTGPRHIGIAFGRKVVSLFGPNHPAWTDTQYDKEIQIVGDCECIFCGRKVCNRKRHYCMESITVQKVLEAAEKLLESE